MVAGGRVNLSDLFLPMLAGLTINLRHPRWEGYVHIYVLAGRSGIKSGRVLCKPAETLNEEWDVM